MAHNQSHVIPVEITTTINGQEMCLIIDPVLRLIDVLRDQLRLPGTKEGCGEGECGSCTVLMNGLPTNSCLVPAFQIQNCTIETIEALDSELLQPLLKSGATQCGACTPGVVMAGEWIVRNPNVLDNCTIRELMAGNICRCTGYDGIIIGMQDRINQGMHGDTE